MCHADESSFILFSIQNDGLILFNHQFMKKSFSFSFEVFLKVSEANNFSKRGKENKKEICDKNSMTKLGFKFDELDIKGLKEHELALC